jgi:hypothetical protein
MFNFLARKSTVRRYLEYRRKTARLQRDSLQQNEGNA